MRDLISIAFACDEGYAKHVAVVMRSILANAAVEDQHKFHVLTMGLTLESENHLREVANRGKATLQIHRVDAQHLAGFPEARHTLNTYLRLLLPELLSNHEKVLYLDADLIVLDSLQELWNYPIGNAAMAIAIDSTAIFQGEALSHFEALQLPKEHIYFNAGVLLLNLKVLRQINLLEQVRLWVTDHSHLMRHSDQDALNVLLAGKLVYFHLRWNLQVPLIAPVQFGWVCTKEQIEAVSKPAIVHYVTSRKPWCWEYKLPYQNLYFQYLAQTPWKNDLPSALTLHQWLCRLREEIDWGRAWIKFKVKQILSYCSKDKLRNYKLH